MFETAGGERVGSVLARLHDVVDELIGLELTSLNGDEVLGVLRELETEHRRLVVVDHALVAEVDSRGLAVERGCASTDRLLRQLLRISIGEASGRTRAAKDLGPRRGLSGELLGPIFPRVAAGQAAGEVSAAQARIITGMIDGLPAQVQAENDEQAEEFLVEQARVFAPEQLGKLAQRLSETLDPDGTFCDERRREASRDLTVRRRSDGSALVAGELTAACTEALLTVLDATARPKPEVDGARDARTPGQRRHDGLLDALLAIVRTGALPQTNGVTTTIILTLTAEQLARHVAGLPAGLVRTGHGAALSTAQALRLCADARAIPVVFGTAKEIVATAPRTGSSPKGSGWR